jgi:alkanesulfonate monooxygenase SsuD/methylene tetrahydromethanopterin reductase-like flavin-dependent oxidoreductase (luciferase family)
VSARRLGLFTRLLPDRPDASASLLYSQAREQFLLAERLGYDVGWVAQHHFDVEEGGLPSPLVFLAWMAAQTERIRLGTAIITLALEDPIRVAEDAAVLDVLCSGRLELGVGTGGDRNGLFANNFHRLRDALHGAGLDARHRPMHPNGHRLLDDLWQATFSVEGGSRAARSGCGLLLSRTQPRPVDAPCTKSNDRSSTPTSRRCRLGGRRGSVHRGRCSYFATDHGQKSWPARVSRAMSTGCGATTCRCPTSST